MIGCTRYNMGKGCKVFCSFFYELNDQKMACKVGVFKCLTLSHPQTFLVAFLS